MLPTSHSPYGAIASFYDGLLTITGFKRGVERFLNRQDFMLPARPRLLDAGCGTGLMALWLRNRFPQSDIVAFDIDREMLHEMKRIIEREEISPGRITLAVGDLKTPQRLHDPETHATIAIPDGYFDGVFVSGALEHVPLEAAVAKLARLMRPGGMFFNLGMRRSPAGSVLGMMYGAKPYSLPAMRRACERAGLEDIRVIRLSVEDFPANLSRIAIWAKKQH